MRCSLISFLSDLDDSDSLYEANLYMRVGLYLGGVISGWGFVWVGLCLFYVQGFF